MGGKQSSQSKPGKNDHWVDIIDGDGEGDQKSFTMKVLVHERVASSAVDTIDDSDHVAQDLSKSLVTDLLQSPQNVKQFGVLLNEIFQFESMLRPSRELFYWSLQSDPTLKSSVAMSKVGLVDFLQTPYCARNLRDLTSYAISQRHMRKDVYIPYIQWILKDKDYVIEPLGELAKWYLPFAQPATTAALKSAATTYLESPEVRTTVKEGLVQIIRKAAESRPKPT